MPTNRLASGIEAQLARSLVLGLHWEYEKALPKAPPVISRRAAARPNIMLADLGKLGSAEPETWTIRLQRAFAAAQRFDAVRDLFLHEVAHLWASIHPEGRLETSHGPVFRALCGLLGADPRATGRTSPGQSPAASADPQDELRARVQKLLALAQSPFPAEAEAAASKASELIARHNLTLIKADRERSFRSRFVCEPARRHPRHLYVVANILQHFFFVEIVWVPAWVVSRKCVGHVPEMSGQPHDIEFAAYVFDFIRAAIRMQWDQARRSHGFGGRESGQFALGVANGFYAKLEADRRTLCERIRAEGEGAAGRAAASPARRPADAELLLVADPRLSDYVRQRYGRLRAIGGRGVVRRSSYYAGQKIGRSLVLHRGIEPEATASGRMLPG